MHKYIEVETPSLTKTPPPDPYIDPLEVYIGAEGPAYLHTSPEMHLKRLLGFGHERIFEICKVYRVEEFEEIHSVEFTMLEWYRGGTYTEAMKETEDLIRYVAGRLFENPKNDFEKPFKIFELEELFVELSGINPFPLSRNDLFDAMKTRGFAGIDEKDTWNDLFFKLLIQEVEPKMKDRPPYMIKDWPFAISTMAKKKEINKVERFELYMRGVEIANGYTELLNSNEQRERFAADNAERERLGKTVFKPDENFLGALSKLEGDYTGVSLGMDRLLMVLLDKESIGDVMVHRFVM